MKHAPGLMLLAAVIASAIWVVAAQHAARRHFIELHALEERRDALDEEWGKLRLEQGAWAVNDRIERLARQQLGMDEPAWSAQIFLVP